MGWGFEIGRTYNRRQDIHGQFGGQQQGGIVTPAKHAVVILITGEEGLQHGYSDRYRPDGVFEYFGEGRLGNMRMRAGNAAIAEHSLKGKSLLLFRKSAGGLRFEGEMICEAFHIERAPDSEGAERDAIVFELRPLAAVFECIESEPSTPIGEPIEQLRRRAFAAAENAVQIATSSTRNVYQRSRDVRAYVLARANGQCEGCGASAPFNRVDGTPYLEPHHLLRLSDGGPDHPAQVIALCPNCHRRVHIGRDGQSYNQNLIERMKSLEKPRGE